MDTTLWNSAFTNMLRQANKASWGNWTLDPTIEVGAVGFIIPETASFQRVGTILGAQITRADAVEVWSVESASTHRTQSSIDFNGVYKDPSTGAEVKTGLQISWSFAKAGSIVSNGTSTGVHYIEEFGTLMQSQYDWLLTQAKSVGFASDAGIVQGFGVIRSVRLCSGSINIGSKNESSTFSLKGSVSGINAMTGGGDVSAGVAGSYKQTNESNSFNSNMWPATANVAADGPIAISYEFISFDGKTIIPSWTTPLSGLTVDFDNRHGGTYIGHCSVTYDVPGTPPGTMTSQSKSVTVWGGSNHAITGIPLQATNVVVKIAFDKGDTFEFPYPTPLAIWPNGELIIDMGGVSPTGAHAVPRL